MELFNHLQNFQTQLVLNFGCDVITEGLSWEFPPLNRYCDVKPYCTYWKEKHTILIQVVIEVAQAANARGPISNKEEVADSFQACSVCIMEYFHPPDVLI